MKTSDERLRLFNRMSSGEIEECEYIKSIVRVHKYSERYYIRTRTENDC